MFLYGLRILKSWFFVLDIFWAIFRGYCSICVSVVCMCFGSKVEGFCVLQGSEKKGVSVCKLVFYGNVVAGVIQKGNWFFVFVFFFVLWGVPPLSYAIRA